MTDIINMVPHKLGVMLKGLMSIIFVCFINIGLLLAQNVVHYPKIGDKLNHEFTDFSDSKKMPVNIQQRKGKWLVLDFWTRGCSSCVASLPKMNKLSKIFADKVELFMVAICAPDSKKDRDATGMFYKKWIESHRLELISAFDTVGDKFDITSVPAIFIINPDGILVAKTTKLDSALLSCFIKGQSPIYEYAFSTHEPQVNQYNFRIPLLTSGKEVNGGVDTAISYRSILTKWNNSMDGYLIYGFNSFLPFASNVGWAEAIGVSLKELYRLGFTGEVGWDKSSDPKIDSLYRNLSTKLILEVKDKSLFSESGEMTIKNSNNSWAYSLKLPESKFNYQAVRKRLINDLDGYLGYTSKLEVRNVKILKLVIQDSAMVLKKLKTKGLNHALKYTRQIQRERVRNNTDSSITVRDEYKIGYSFFNKPFQAFFKSFWDAGLNIKILSTTGNMAEKPLIIDSTGIDFRIDISFKNDPKDWDATVKTLNEYGLGVIEGGMLMKCIVIRDADASLNKSK